MNKLIYCLPIFLVFLTCCNGQKKAQPPTMMKEQTMNIIGQPKLIKAKGSNESNNVRCGLQDHAGNLWFGTTGDGVYRYDGKQFFNYTIKDGLKSNTVYSILEDKEGNIWLGTSEGICRYDGKKIVAIALNANIRPVTTDNNFYSAASTKNTVWSMLQDKNGQIWFGTGDGVYYYNGMNFLRLLDRDGVVNTENLHLKMIDCILEDKNGTIWFASGCPPGEEGVCRYDGKSIVSFKPNGDGWIRSIREDKKGNLWFGGRSHGNFVYDGRNFAVFTDKQGIGNPILTDKSGKIWFNGEEKQSTVESQEGIWCYDGKSFKNFGTKDGMSKYFVCSMLEDKNGNIWMGTRNTGLFKYDGKSFVNFSEDSEKR